MTNDTVEIMLATYNGEKYLQEQIESIVDQTCTDWHLTVSDDASTDSSFSIAQLFASQYPHKISAIRRDVGFGNAKDHFLELIRHCDSDYIMLCDQDDYWKPDKVFKTRKALVKAEKNWGSDTPILVFSDQVPADHGLRPIDLSLFHYQNLSRSFGYKDLVFQNVITGCSMGFNRALAEMALRAPDTSDIEIHDEWIAIVAACFGKIVFIDEPLSFYRQHGGNEIGAVDTKSIKYGLSRIGNIKKTRMSVINKKKQAAKFLDIYGSEMSAEQKAFFEAFSKKKSGIRFYRDNEGSMHGMMRMVGYMILG